jgi:hypothetical protein
LPEAHATLIAEHLLRHAAAFGLTRPEDTLDVLDVSLSLVEVAPRSLYLHGMLGVVLSITSWPIAARIAFLRRHLTGRAVTPGSEAEARVLFGVDAGPAR